MNNQNRNSWIYLVGIIIMFGLLIVIATQVILPIFQRNRQININLNLPKPELTIDTSRNYLAKVTTNLGIFEIELCSACAPQNVNNFVYLAQKDYYVNTKFHRVIKDLLFQGGDRNTLSADYSTYGKGKTNYLIEDEVNWDALALSQEKRELLTQQGFSSNATLPSKRLTRYTVAMANDGPNTNSSQFFVITADNSDSRLEEFNGRFTVIGEIRSGFDTLSKINDIEISDVNSFRPNADILLEKIEITIL